MKTTILKASPLNNVRHTEFDTFLQWVEGTALFDAIKHLSGKRPEDLVIIEALTDKESMSIQLNGTKIEKATDLPKEILLKFWQNSPWWVAAKDIRTQEVVNLQDSITQQIEYHYGNKV